MAILRENMNFPSVISTLRGSVPLSPHFLGITLALLFVVWLLYSLILYYHLNKYSPEKLGVLKMTFIYFGGSLFLFVVLLVSYVMYLSSSI